MIKLVLLTTTPWNLTKDRAPPLSPLQKVSPTPDIISLSIIRLKWSGGGGRGEGDHEVRGLKVRGEW